MIDKKYFFFTPLEILCAKIVKLVFLTGFTLFIFFFLSCINVAQTKPPVDILIFSPHPDDETLACAGTILKAVQENKKVNPARNTKAERLENKISNGVKIVFLTNGDACADCASQWLKKEKEKLTPEDYIMLGKERQKEAIRAIKKLGLNEEDAFFLSYPDGYLCPMCAGEYAESYESPMTKVSRSPYERTYGRAKKAYQRENLISDIKDILKKYKPKKIYLPHFSDTDSIHMMTTKFVNLALDKLEEEKESGWIGNIDFFYYLIHPPVSIEDTSLPYLYTLFPTLNYKEDVSKFKEVKRQALGEYHTQQFLKKPLFEKSIADNELFSLFPNNTQGFLKIIEEEWLEIGRVIKEKGGNVNFGVVCDVAEDTEDMGNPLTAKGRIYSEDPGIVTKLALAQIKGMNRAGVIPVVKHFPGLGRASQDTHLCLPQIKASQEELYKRDILPFKELLKEKVHLWIMIDHAIYPSLDEEPASLSYKIQTEILRRELGFKGIIIVDELLNMQAIREYAIGQAMKEPYIGEIVVMAFRAGADIVIVYPPIGKQKEEIILNIINIVKNALAKGELSQESIDISVKRILREKEMIYHRPLQYLLKNMSLEEKILQKILIDAYEDTKVEKEFKDIEILKRYNLGGVYAHHRNIIEKLQKDSKIPMFIVAQHEGGLVYEGLINRYTPSAYLIGKEFERLAAKEGIKVFRPPKKKSVEEKLFYDFNNLDKSIQQEIIRICAESVDTVIRAFSELKEKEFTPVNPDYLSPLSVNNDGKIMIKPFSGWEIANWVRRFPNQKIAFCAYQFFKQTFERWLESQSKAISSDKYDCLASKIIFQLTSFREEIKKPEMRQESKNKDGFRILCLATHPDDEDAEVLLYFKKKFGCQTYLLLATRGEGGENLINSSLYNDLGFLRTEETERSASVLEVKKIYYLNKKDFGYCTEEKEALKNWGEEDTLKKIVYFYRLIRPHIIITKHAESDEHCQHLAFLSLAKKAFDLGADSNFYPETIKEGLEVWRPFKFYQRNTNKDSLTGNTVVINPEEVILPENKSIHKIALEALKQHKTQGSGEDWLGLSEDNKIHYRLVKSNFFLDKGNTFFDGISLSLDKEKDKKVCFSGVPGIKIINNLKIGLIEERDNTLFIALKNLGCDFKKIDQEHIIAGDGLSQFDTIIVGNKVYNTSLINNEIEDKLFEFVKNGGNLVVFLPYFMQSELPRFPYPLDISYGPITDENAPIEILVPSHPLFNFPNRISSADFEGWIQERGLAFPSNYSENYRELTSCFSNSKKQIKSGYLVAHYGKGSYIYTGYTWYRQFRSFHIGAYKNLANMLSYRYAEKKAVE